MTYLWINITDLDGMGTLGPLGSPVTFCIRPELGDRLLEGAYYKPQSNIDDAYLVVETSQERASAIDDVLQLFGVKKLRRKVRTKQTISQPDANWKNVQQPAP